MLSQYRALDLTDEKGFLCGKILADLGADVLKVEKPGGDSARKIGPFFHDQPAPEKSLYWWAYNANKRGVTLNIESPCGRNIFRRLAEKADFVMESFSPGFLDEIGLGYTDLEKINPGLIMVSISPFGQTGPYRNYKTSDIVAFAAGGRMYPTGDDDRPPLRIGHHSQSYLHAGADGAVGAMLALYHREMTGEGQHVDVSIQASVAPLFQYSNYWDALRVIPQRLKVRPPVKQTWPCKDGYVVWGLWGGGPNARRFNMSMIEWLESEGIDVEYLKKFDWENWNTGTTTYEEAARLQSPMAEFFLSHTRAELLESAVKHHVMLCPINTTEDVMRSGQLDARGYWVALEHPELGCEITYPGAFAISSDESPAIYRRSPLIGEHNLEIYGGELGISREKIHSLKQAGVI